MCPITLPLTPMGGRTPIHPSVPHPEATSSRKASLTSQRQMTAPSSEQPVFYCFSCCSGSWCLLSHKAQSSQERTLPEACQGVCVCTLGGWKYEWMDGWMSHLPSEPGRTLSSRRDAAPAPGPEISQRCEHCTTPTQYPSALDTYPPPNSSLYR